MKFVENKKPKSFIVLNLKTLEFPVLIDLLSQHTATYTKLLADSNRSEEFEAVKELIQILQEEIENRKHVPGFIPPSGKRSIPTQDPFPAASLKD